MRLITWTGALALTALTLGAAPSFAQERCDRHNERDRVSSRRPTFSLSLVFGNTRPYRSDRYRRSEYDSRARSYGYSYGRSSHRSCSRGDRGSYASSEYGRNDRSYRSDDYEQDRDDDYGRSNRGYRRY